MKSEKITNVEVAGAKRWYDDACGTALALEFVGERWSLLVMRELLFGPRRFGQIKAMLPGISANVLTQRLTSLEEAGIVVREKLPPPASVQVYDLTRWGRESEGVMQEMGRWAVLSRRHDPTLFFSPASAMTSLRTMIDRDRVGDLRVTAGFRFEDDSFLAEVADRAITIRRAAPDTADVLFTGTTFGMCVTIYGKMPFAEAQAAGLMRVEGDPALAARFIDLFHLPEKIA
jgi:DNA-binding HxlR family transcriptional regulator